MGYAEDQKIGRIVAPFARALPKGSSDMRCSPLSGDLKCAVAHAADCRMSAGPRKIGLTGSDQAVLVFMMMFVEMQEHQ